MHDWYYFLSRHLTYQQPTFSAIKRTIQKKILGSFGLLTILYPFYKTILTLEQALFASNADYFSNTKNGQHIFLD